MWESTFSLIGAVFMVGLVLFLAWMSSRMLGKGYMKAASGRNIKVLEQVRVGTEQSLLLVKLQEKVFLIGAGQEGFQLLAELEGDFEEKLPEGFQEGFAKGFAALLRKEREKNDE